MRPGVLLGTAAAFLAGMATAIMTGNALVRMRQETKAAAAREELSAPAKAAQDWLDQDDFLSKLNQANRHIAAAVEPSVVHLIVTSQGFVNLGNGRRGVRQVPSTGSGWVYDAAGHIVTNSHVIGGVPNPDAEVATTIMVHFADGRAFPGKVVGADDATDIAVLQVDSAAPLIPARRATSSPVQQGDRVYAFGSPFGFRFSMSQGIISALSRNPLEGPSQSSYTNYLQTDAAVNPGNSGGPLCDVRGRVVGMNVAIVTDGSGSAGSRGVGFAVPLSTIEPIVDQIVTHGQVARGFLGVNFPATDDRNTSALRATNFGGTGVLVEGVVFGAPAESAGVLAGDVIAGVNGELVRGVAHFRTMVATKRPGDSIAVRLWRAGDTREATVTLADLAENDKLLQAAASALRGFGIGIELAAGSAVTVVAVSRDSRASEMGFRPGDQFTSVGSRPIKSYVDLLSALALEKFHEGRPVQLTSVRAGDERKLTIQLQGEN